MGGSGSKGVGISPCAEYMHNAADSLNTGITPGNPFTIDVPIFVNDKSVVHIISTLGGTVFNLKKTGIYLFDYETSLEDPGAIGLYIGTALDNMTLDQFTVAGSTTALTWIHGRALVQVTDHAKVVAVSPVSGPATVCDAGGTGLRMIRVTIYRIK
jgi:hypothetical protein